MCSFIFTNINIRGNYKTGVKSRYRGPETTNTVYIDDYMLSHNLLDVSNHLMIQPIYQDDIALLYNGEIYSPGVFRGRDTEQIIPFYEEFGPMFVNEISGEYGICICDFRNRTVNLYTDIFGTKPIYYSIESGNIGISTYASDLTLLGFRNNKRVEPSTYIKIDLDTLKIIEKKTHSVFTIMEDKTSYDTCASALQNAVNCRADQPVAVGISSGYESGYLLQQTVNNPQHRFYYIKNGLEDSQVMDTRFQLCEENGNKCTVINYTDFVSIYNQIEDLHLKKRCENGDVYCTATSAKMLSSMMRKIKNNNMKIFLSGQGGDEILSNYHGPHDLPFFAHNNLKNTFPWANFYGGCNRLNIDMCEYVGGSHGIECRYPFLDRHFVQEFLNLHTKLKTRKYKSVLNEMLKISVANNKIHLYNNSDEA